jgi:PIN domain nuclease of toxin-antitoxin system
MNLLLDTHAFLWFVWKDPRLSNFARTLILDPKNVLLFSAASYWEIAVKVSIGKLTLAEPFAIFMPREIVNNRLVILPIGLAHASAAAALPLHHRDPFDRMLIAQSIVEQSPLVSADRLLDLYSVRRLW